jgi:hypothetical protein
MKPLAWLIEEYDSQGKMLWYVYSHVRTYRIKLV